MQKYSLVAQTRSILGKKVKKLRKEGIIPATVYGRGMDSLSVQLPLKDFMKTYKDAGETAVVMLSVNDSKRPVLIHNVEYDYIAASPIHVDFFQVNLKEKVKTMVPIVLLGEAQAVTGKLGLLLQTLSHVEVEALPTDLPENIEIDVTPLAEVNQQITVAEISASPTVTILTDPSQTIVKISELVSKEAEQQAQEEQTASEEAKETPEGEGPASEEAAKTEPTEEKAS